MAKGTASMEGDLAHGAPLPQEEIYDLSKNLSFQMKNFISLLRLKNIFNPDTLNFLPWSPHGMMKGSIGICAGYFFLNINLYRK